MLDRTKIIKELSLRSGNLIDVVQNEYVLAQKIWQSIAFEKNLSSKLAGNGRAMCPLWAGSIGVTVPLKSQIWYQALAVDGSQIYPDRHQGTSCFLLNMGVVHLQYLSQASSVTFDSRPLVVFEGERGMEDYTPEMVNAQRMEEEFCTALSWMEKIKKDTRAPSLFLLDGSLIFWHLLQATASDMSDFLVAYLRLLDIFYQNKYPLAGYISSPKSKDLVNILKAAAATEGQAVEFAHISDSTIAHLYLEPGSRSILFESKSPVCAIYPEGSKPYFFYLNTGLEIARVEVPAWIALDADLLETVAGIIYDQALKGHGYPISLAEAHEQAVVTTADREFFYHILQSMVPAFGALHGPSQKSMKKRRMSV